jgi:sec-independent protein translocase protein TatA
MGCPSDRGHAVSIAGVNLQAPELLIILVVILLLFGGAKLPKLARSLGQAQKEFKEGIKDGNETAPPATPPADPNPPATPGPEAADGPDGAGGPPPA